MTQIEQTLHATSKPVRAILETCLDGTDLSVNDAVTLFSARGTDLMALIAAADTLRQEQCGDAVTYVVNRNINFTNVCVKACKFCAFSRDLRSEQGYFLPPEEVIRRARQAADYGATEVCVQAGLAPSSDGRDYIELCSALSQALPELHLHAYSPEEIKYGATRANMSFQAYLEALQQAGIGSLPGTSAEILDDDLRKRISPSRISVDEWVDVVTTAHRLGIRTTSTMMFGHVETFRHRAEHMALLRDIQKQTGGFTEFVPLSFVHSEAPMFVEQQVPGVQPGPTGDDVIRLYAIARLMLGRHIPNLQASWVKEGLRMTQWLLNCGVNDVGGTLMNESISTSAGAAHGQLVTPAMLRRLIRDAGRQPVQRDTHYNALRKFGLSYVPGEEVDEPLTQLTDPDSIFGTYDLLTQNEQFHYDFDTHFNVPSTH